MMRKIYPPLPITLLLAVWVATAASCGKSGDQKQEGPSVITTEPDLASSISFIGNLSSLDSSSIIYDRHEVIFEKGAPCIATFQNPNGHRGRWIVDFSKLNPDSVEIAAGAIVQVRTTNAELIIRYERFGKAFQAIPIPYRRNFSEPRSNSVAPAMITDRRTPINQGELIDTLNFHVKNEADVSKVKDALVYVIRKCGGKGDLFNGKP